MADYYKDPTTGELYPNKEYYLAEQEVLKSGMTPTTSNIKKAMSGKLEETEGQPGSLAGTMRDAEPGEVLPFANSDMPFGEMDQLTLFEMGLQDISRAALAEGYGEGMKTAWGGVDVEPSQVGGNTVQQMANFVQEGVRSPILSAMDKMTLMVDNIRKSRNQMRDDSRQLVNLAMNQEVWNDMPESRRKELWDAAGFTGQPIKTKVADTGLSEDTLLTLAISGVPSDVANYITRQIKVKSPEAVKEDLVAQHGEKGKDYMENYLRTMGGDIEGAHFYSEVTDKWYDLTELDDLKRAKKELDLGYWEAKDALLQSDFNQGEADARLKAAGYDEPVTGGEEMLEKARKKLTEYKEMGFTPEEGIDRYKTTEGYGVMEDTPGTIQRLADEIWGGEPETPETKEEPKKKKPIIERDVWPKEGFLPWININL